MVAAEESLDQLNSDFQRVREEVGKVLVGQDEVVESVLIALFAGGHCLLEGVPGLGKTLLVRTLSGSLALDYSRIQFTPDLMPADITGTRIVTEDERGRKNFEFQKGPIFAQIVLADEINRATPKTQSALLEAMQESEVTAGGETHSIDQPFIVLATQNPLEMDGTYPLPEAQLDRFLFKVHVPFPKREELNEVLTRTTGQHVAEVEPVLNGDRILEHRQSVRRVEAAPHVQDFAVRMLLATHPDSEFATEEVQKWVRYGASPRGVQSLLLGAKVRAALDRRLHVGFDDVRQTAPAALRHRVLLGFEGEAEGIPVDDIIAEVIAKTEDMSDSGLNNA
ncbi:AAA family ATPase [bacterium TMED181]|nr:AAA family ATPase [Planctomycetota bacterium]OUW47579.1 MAG: AAA family ATPase [bacterium TMED181]